MQFTRDTADVFVPDGLPAPEALARTTHLAIGAHPDDIEMMAPDGILQCYQRSDRWLCAVVLTDGGGSPRGGPYRDYSDEDMRAVRRAEQKEAAVIGEYGALVLLDYPSASVKDAADPGPVDDLAGILRMARPGVVYTHNLADRHDTHVSTALRTIEAIRRLPANFRPERLYGCEVWRDLDWLVEGDKVAFDVSAHPDLQAALLSVFVSQIAGGKRYDLAVLGRRRANATFHESHSVDETAGLAFAMDLTPLILDPTLDVQTFVESHIDRFADEVRGRLANLLG